MEKNEVAGLRKPDGKLRLALHINWGFSLLSGLLLILFETWMVDTFDLVYPFSSTGVQLLSFALLVGFAAFYPYIKRGLILTIIVLDILWVLFCLGVLLSPTGMTIEGKLLVLWSMVMVGTLAYLQWKGLKNYQNQKS